MDVKHVLRRKGDVPVETIGAQETVGALVARLADRNIGALMVMSGEGALVGVISERDVVRALAEEQAVCLTHPVSRYMTADVVTATPQDDAIDVLDRMTKGRFRHMPVLDRESMIGVISIGDVVKARIEQLQRDNAALEEFIRG